MKNNLKGRTKLIKGGINFLKGKLNGSRTDKIKGAAQFLEGKARLKVDQLLK